jgi:uncharacterized DUF497 family protein
MGNFNTIMEFEFDLAKSAGNQTKHGLDFDQAQALWQDPDGLVIPSRQAGEPRKLLVAKAVGKLWTAIFTERGGKTRIISVRRARDNERHLYEHD